MGNEGSHDEACMKAIVSKQSIRELTKMRRLPPRLKMFLAGAWLQDVLVANGLDKKFRLWNMSYWVVAHSLDSKRMRISWFVSIHTAFQR